MSAPIDLSTMEIALLCLAALAASTIDAIAGGGGLITVPALLAVGLPPHAALGTNKGQAMFGSCAALLRYTHAGLVDTRAARGSFLLGLLGSAAGAGIALWIDPDVLRPLVLVLLLAVAAFMVFGRVGSPEATAPTGPIRRRGIILGLIALGIGGYDGFFGPGTGTFLIASYVAFVHLPIPRATAEAKVVNFASNIAAAAVFGVRGVILWYIAIPMAAAQLLGGFLGAHLAVRRGVGLIRGTVLLVVLVLVIKVVRDLYLEGR